MIRAAFCIASSVLLFGTGASAQVSKTFVYDAQGRLVVSTRSAPSGGARTTTYTFDDADNRTNRVITASSAALSAPMPERMAEARTTEPPVPSRVDGPMLIARPHATGDLVIASRTNCRPASTELTPDVPEIAC